MDDFDIHQIDEVIHGRLRLGIMAYLSTAGSADFNQLKAQLQTSDGNLSTHLRKLEEAGFIAIDKTFQARKPLTRVAMTGSGREAFVAYLAALEKLLPNAAGK
ncbi:transcriptional regulator [Asticcacaulis sp. EMRT-3]|uniref:winged helix-turn-helix domain-containing protein n=1 Tax=Asticcacaulis sp. EMRT-3 TaxID=3040349 RepID=UPI0024AFEE55|nr:transcriptional regulator [Asticcacaulis sp. EMRT-3]MDI7773819.1 transcriptional regulator [Asticcacaulis sp. EMRT-3]